MGRGGKGKERKEKKKEKKGKKRKERGWLKSSIFPSEQKERKENKKEEEARKLMGKISHFFSHGNSQMERKWTGKSNLMLLYAYTPAASRCSGSS